MSIAKNLNELKNHIPENVKLIAVSKTKPLESIMEAYKEGQRIFGENKPQELKNKYFDLPKDIEWHMIGHLQTNKVKLIAPFISLIHAVDSFKLLEIINKEAIKNNRTINFLFQLHIAREENKFGLSYDELTQILESNSYSELKNINPIGIMGMGSFTNEKSVIRNEFNGLQNILKKIKSTFFSEKDDFKEISMGMSGDYNIAIKEGSTMVRIGSSIFGLRNI